MPNTELQPFIDAAKQQGAGDEFLAALLTRRGWPAGDVYNALGDWWSRTTGVAVPARRGAAENARDAFLYLLAFSTLATWASALGSLWFELIEHWLPDAVVNRYINFRSAVTWQMAAILVALPIYLLVMRLILRETALHPDRIESGVRKWLTYIALLITASAVVGDLVCFVDYFLKGELTLRFVLKCATVLAICGSIFWYYLGFLRGQTRSGHFALAAVAGAALGIFFGLTVAGTPAEQRHMEADVRRVEDLRNVATAITARRSLPASLSELPNARVADPETRQPYTFTANSTTEYQLCAVFAAPGGDGFWAHQRGRTCYSLNSSSAVPW
jgi:hypothetical protein